VIFTIRSIINFVFPPKCIFCGGVLDFQKTLEICGSCYNTITFTGSTSIRPDVRSHYDRVISVCEYSGIVKAALIKYKFFNKAGYYRAFAGLLCDKVKKMTNAGEFDIIISVPLHKNRERVRQYNQSGLIAKTLSRELKIPGSRLLVRTRDTNTQSLTSRKERGSNVKGAFKVHCPQMIHGKSILLVDDILTTGNTLDECSKVLKEAGARSICAAVIAVSKKH